MTSARQSFPGDDVYVIPTDPTKPPIRAFVSVDENGVPIAAATGGDASAANQVTANANIGATNEAAAATPSATSGLHGLLAGLWTAFLSLIGALTETAPATDTASSGLNGRMQRLAQRVTALIALFPTALGGTTSANSFPVVLSSDGPFATQTGSITETAPASDTASSGLNGRLQRIAQRITSLIAQLPASLGVKAASASMSVTLASDEPLIGIATETAPASDTASSGLNGRMQRIAQRLTSLIALVPTSLGQKAKASALAVTLASDEDILATLGATGDAAATQGSTGSISAKLRTATSQLNALLTGIILAAGENHVGAFGGHTIVQAASSTITRPADTTAYASGDLVANSTTAGSVAALQFTTAARVSGGGGAIVGARIQKSTTGVTNAAFRVHFFDTTPTFTSAGDNSAISTVVVASAKGYLGYVDITAMTGFSDVAWGTGAPDNARGSIPFKATAQIIYAIIEARGAYTPGNAEVFTISAMIFQD